MSKLLTISIIEEEARRKASFYEIKTLEELVQNISTRPAIEVLLDITRFDLGKTQDLNADLINSAPHPALKFNKLKEIFTCTDKLIQNDYALAIQGKLLSKYTFDSQSRTILGGTLSENVDIINYSGTSMPNCIQNTYFAVLRAIGVIESVTNLSSSAEDNIYNINNSPNLQTTKFPSDFDSSPYQNWFYFYKDTISTESGELLIPNLGYAFGGSRADSRYFDKEFREEDCSSSLAKWLKASEPFTTRDMKSLFDNDPSCDTSSYCKAAKEVLIPIKDFTDVNLTGTAFFFPGHTGVVTNHFMNLKVIETLSYSRDMPKVEGLGYKNYTLNEEEFLFFNQNEKWLFDSNQEL